MNASDRDLLRSLAEKATPGPWTKEPDECGIYAKVVDDGVDEFFEFIASPVDDDNTEFIAAANPAVILSLLTALDAAERVVEAARKAGTCRDYHNKPALVDEFYSALAAYDAATTAKEGTTR